MCLYPKKMINKKYTVTDKNGGCVPLPPIIGKNKEGWNIYDDRVLMVDIPCGNCEECRKQQAREWQVRLTEELKEWDNAYFMTLTFSPEGLKEICWEKNIKENNACAAYALRHMLERWRKKHKKSLKHWFITELGHENTERIHMHGIIFTNEKLEFSEKNENNLCKWEYWKYGHIYVGDYCSIKTINYIIKYINKIDNDHKWFKGQILASPGIGKSWLDNLSNKPINYAYRPKNTIDYYQLNTGNKIKLPKYYCNHLRNEEEREQIWREFMDREKISITGNTYDLKSTTITDIGNVTKKAQEINLERGYGNDSQEWRKYKKNITKRMLEHNTLEYKIQKYKEKCKLKGTDPNPDYIKKLEEIVKNYNKNLED